MFCPVGSVAERRPPRPQYSVVNNIVLHIEPGSRSFASNIIWISVYRHPAALTGLLAVIYPTNICTEIFLIFLFSSKVTL